jgi:hypothetical protein
VGVAGWLLWKTSGVVRLNGRSSGSQIASASGKQVGHQELLTGRYKIDRKSELIVTNTGDQLWIRFPGQSFYRLSKRTESEYMITGNNLVYDSLISFSGAQPGTVDTITVKSNGLNVQAHKVAGAL